jgi:hypothetical protein
MRTCRTSFLFQWLLLQQQNSPQGEKANNKTTNVQEGGGRPSPPNVGVT